VQLKKIQRLKMHIHNLQFVIGETFRSLFKYNAFCVISDGVNNKMGSLFSQYDFFYSWRKITGDEKLDKGWD
jgi:type I site-specific restriction-modification system R (restriction) subunit